MIAFLEDNSEVAFRPYAYHPDYLATLPGATLSGRVLEPVPFDAIVLGKHFASLRPPLPEFTLFGGMMVDRTDIGHLLNAAKSPRSLLYAAGLVSRYGLHRMRFARGARLVMGNALVGRLYHSLLQRGVPVLTSTQAEPLIAQDGRITGAKVTSPDGTLHHHQPPGNGAGDRWHLPQSRAAGRTHAELAQRPLARGRRRHRRRRRPRAEGRRPSRQRARRQQLLVTHFAAQARATDRSPPSRIWCSTAASPG